MDAVFIALSPNPIGFGFLISIGIVFKIVNMNKPDIILKILAESRTLLTTSFNSINGDMALFSIYTNVSIGNNSYYR